MGVGGDTSWGRPVHDRYTLPPANYQYRFSLIPFDPDNGSPRHVAPGTFDSPIPGN